LRFFIKKKLALLFSTCKEFADLAKIIMAGLHLLKKALKEKKNSEFFNPPVMYSQSRRSSRSSSERAERNANIGKQHMQISRDCAEQLTPLLREFAKQYKSGSWGPRAASSLSRRSSKPLNPQFYAGQATSTVTPLEVDKNNYARYYDREGSGKPSRKSNKSSNRGSNFQSGGRLGSVPFFNSSGEINPQAPAAAIQQAIANISRLGGQPSDLAIQETPTETPTDYQSSFGQPSYGRSSSYRSNTSGRSTSGRSTSGRSSNNRGYYSEVMGGLGDVEEQSQEDTIATPPRSSKSKSRKSRTSNYGNPQIIPRGSQYYSEGEGMEGGSW
jgi:hypothetical protein